MRLASLTKEQLDPEQLDLYQRIVGGPRASGPQHFALTDGAGALAGPFGIMLHAPALGHPLQDLGAAIRYRTGLSARVREIAILSVAAATDSAFERYAHQRVDRAAGLTDAELAELAHGRFASDDPVEAAAYALCDRLNRGRLPLSDEDFAALRAALGEAALVELVVLVGYYRTLSQLLHVFDVGAPPEDGAAPEAEAGPAPGEGQPPPAAAEGRDLQRKDQDV
jgi:4-carboxymuconolactone decarboxylase